jgi:hypothetical protein
MPGKTFGTSAFMWLEVKVLLTRSRRTDFPIQEISSVMNTRANIVIIRDMARPRAVKNTSRMKRRAKMLYDPSPR